MVDGFAAVAVLAAAVVVVGLAAVVLVEAVLAVVEVVVVGLAAVVLLVCGFDDSLFVCGFEGCEFLELLLLVWVFDDWELLELLLFELLLLLLVCGRGGLRVVRRVAGAGAGALRRRWPELVCVLGVCRAGAAGALRGR